LRCEVKLLNARRAFHRRGSRLARVDVAAGQDDVGAVGCELAGRDLPDTGIGTGDEDRASGQVW